MTLESLSGQKRGFGDTVFWVARDAKIDADLVAGGGGGGGTHEDAWLWGGGGSHAERTLAAQQPLERDHYFLEVGKGGAGGASNLPSADGAPGGVTRLRRCSSGLLVGNLNAQGGVGGKGDAVQRRQANGKEYAGDGESLVDSITGGIIGSGGPGGYWQTGGGTASGAGAGGGGQGGTTHPGQSAGGSGSAGYAKLTKIGG